MAQNDSAGAVDASVTKNVWSHRHPRMSRYKRAPSDLSIFNMAATASASKKDQSFPSWSFDKACGSMEWNELVTATISTSTDTASYQETDLVLIGVYPPPEKTAGASDEEEKDKLAPPEIHLVGFAKELDERLGGALTEVLTENHESFQHGASVGSTTPTLRYASPTIRHGKVRFYFKQLARFPSETLTNQLHFIRFRQYDTS